MSAAAPAAVDYDPARCDLCGATGTTVIIDKTGRAFTSDGQIVAGDLRKVECAGCGLVRNGLALAAAHLDRHYQGYTLAVDAAVAEPQFFTASGVVPRSAVIAAWIGSSAEQVLGRPPASVLEVGCGEGRVLATLATRWPTAIVSGIDLSSAAVALARDRGVDAAVGGYHDARGRHEVIFAFAVLEHVPSPRDFLLQLRSRLAPGGLLIVAQPCQDRGSNDVFFCDHLHHFYSRHVAALGQQAGLVERLRVIGHEPIADFSLHVFAEQGTVGEEPASRDRTPAVRETVARWQSVFDRVDAWVAQHDPAITVWGLGQMFQLWSAYTRLGATSVTEGYDDNPERFAGRMPFPVAVLERAAVVGAPVLLTFAPQRRAVARLDAAGRGYFAPLGDVAS